MLAFRTYRSPWKKVALLRDQLAPRHYVLNELAGIAHVVPDYAKLLAVGTTGIVARTRARRNDGSAADSSEWTFLEAVTIAAEGLAQLRRALRGRRARRGPPRSPIPGAGPSSS